MCDTGVKEIDDAADTAGDFVSNPAVIVNPSIAAGTAGSASSAAVPLAATETVFPGSVSSLAEGAGLLGRSIPSEHIAAVSGGAGGRGTGAHHFAGVQPFNPDPFNFSQTNVPLIGVSPQFRALEDATARQLQPSSRFSEALRGDPPNHEAALRFFNTQAIPQIRQNFSIGGPLGDSLFSGARGSAEAQARAQFLEQERNNVFARMFQANQQLPAFAGILDVDRQTRQKQLEDAIRVWAQEQGFSAKAANSALRLAGTQAQTELGFIGAEQGDRRLDLNELQIRENIRLQEEAREAAEDAAFMSTLGSLFGTGAGLFFGGPAGAAAGGAVGGAVFGGGAPFSDMLRFNPSGGALPPSQFGGIGITPPPLFRSPGTGGIGLPPSAAIPSPSTGFPGIGAPQQNTVGDLDPFSSAQALFGRN